MTGIFEGHYGVTKSFVLVTGRCPMQQALSTREVAERVVALIGTQDRTGLDQAVAILNAYYPGQPELVVRAYDLACTLVLKRIVEAESKPDDVINPGADLAAILALRSIMAGQMGQAYDLLQRAYRGGARRNICKTVAIQLLKVTVQECKAQAILYTKREIVSVDIVKVAEAGVLVLRRGSPKYFSNQAHTCEIQFHENGDQCKDSPSFGAQSGLSRDLVKLFPSIGFGDDIRERAFRFKESNENG